MLDERVSVSAAGEGCAAEGGGVDCRGMRRYWRLRGRTSNHEDEIQGFFAPLRMTTFYFTLAIFTLALVISA
jgi:hypothetical protein